MTTALLSLGANIGDPLAQLQGAARSFAPWAYAHASIYRTAPWGVTDQQDFLNTALLVRDPTATAEEWLVRAQAAEQAAGRTRDRHWGPRTLDVDIISCWQDDAARTPIVSTDPQLLLPHPHATERSFVLVPALEMLSAHHPDLPLTGEFRRALAALLAHDPAVATSIQRDATLHLAPEGAL